MITIRPETAEDYAAIREVNALAFGREVEPRLVDALRELPDFVPELSLVAIEAGRVVGHILFSPMVIETKDGAVPALPAPLAVRPG
jgi:putative acetyltransferase